MVTSSYPKFPGDATAPFIQSIAEGIAEEGHEIDVVLPEHPDLAHPEQGRIQLRPYSYAPRKEWTVWGYAQSLESDVSVRKGVYLLAPLVALALRRAVARALRETSYDVLHVHWVVPNAAFLLGIARAHTIPLVVSLHGSDVFLAERMRLAGSLARRSFREAGITTACSQDLALRALALGARPERTKVVHYGVDPLAFSPGKGGRARERLGIGEGEILVLGVGRFVEKKGFRVLLEAAAGVPGLHVVLAGDGDLRGDLESLAKGARVTFAGRLTREEMAQTLGAADIVAVPSIVDRAGNVDGLPNTLLEAMAAGRAVIGTDVGGIPEVIVDGVTGLLVPQKDPGALRKGLVRLGNDKALRDSLGEKARTSVLGGYSWSKVAAEFLSCYAEAAALDAR
jgi:glycosyltransferase involved in cell wall biosynthesis